MFRPLSRLRDATSYVAMVCVWGGVLDAHMECMQVCTAERVAAVSVHITLLFLLPPPSATVSYPRDAHRSPTLEQQSTD